MVIHKSEKQAEASVRPLLRWAGSKQKLLPKISAYWKEGYNRYLEPFVGSGALFYSIAPSRAVLSDINGDLIDCLKTVKKRPGEVYKRLIEIPKGKESFYKVREMDPTALRMCERAARFIFLNRYCFNGLYRTNQQGKFNVPYAASGTGGIQSRDIFMSSAKRLSGVTIECGDFEDVIRRYARKGDFVYFDPPYAVSARRIFSEYGKKSFGKDDLERLRQLLRELDKRSVAWVLSYAYSKEALETFRYWPMKKVFAQRNIAGFAKHRRKAAELIVTNAL